MYNCSTNKMISLNPIVNFVKKTSAGLPQAQFENYIIYVVPFIYSAISNGVTLSTGFAIVSKQTATQKATKPQIRITVNCNTQSEDGVLNTNQEIVMYINCDEDTTPETNLTRVNRIMLNEENSDDLTEPGELLKAYTEGTTTPIWNIKQYSIDEFYGCALFVGVANITNLDKEYIFTSDVN